MESHKCFWDKDGKTICPFEEKPTDPGWCQACVDVSALRMQVGIEFGQKVFMINSLILTYGSPEKAKEIFDQLVDYAKTWGAPKVQDDKSEKEVE